MIADRCLRKQRYLTSENIRYLLLLIYVSGRGNRLSRFLISIIINFFNHETTEHSSHVSFKTINQLDRSSL